MKHNNQAGKRKDRELFSRLFHYVKPFLPLFFISLILLTFMTLLELFNPYLVKLAIDDHISLQNRTIYQVDSPRENSVSIDGKNYVFNDLLKNNKDYIKEEKIFKDKDNYYIDSYKLSEDDIKAIRTVDNKGLNKVSVVFLLVILATFILAFLQEYLLNYTGQKIIFNIRNDLFNHMQNLSLHFFDNNKIGSLVTRVTNDTETLNELFTSVLVQLFQDLFTLLGIIIIMLRMNTKLALISFIFLPALIFVAIYFQKKLRITYKAMRAQLSLLNAKLAENISGMTTIQIFNRQDKAREDFDTSNKNYLAAFYDEIKNHAMLRPLVELTNALTVASIIYFGGRQVLNLELELGTLYIFIIYVGRFFGPIFELTEKFNIIQSAMTSADRIFHMFDVDDFIKEADNPKALDNVKGTIEFKNVWFAYQDEDWIIKDLSFKLEPGESLAIVGSTGAGKTTIINLITRFYDIQKGEILLDGINIKDLSKKDLRKAIGVVLQDVFLFTGKVKDNIRLLNLDITDRDIREISQFVYADKFIEKLPDSYDEPVKERGATFSTGERQLISFARTLAADPKILILDEATANIDTETESFIQEAIDNIVKERTTIAIAHRLSTIQNMDRIMVLDKGRLVEIGSHDELLALKGHYYNLYKLQY